LSLGHEERADSEPSMLKEKDDLMRYIFVNVIAAGLIDWKQPMTAPNQPAIREAAMICTNEELEIMWESVGELTAQSLAAYASAIGNGAIVVGHSVEYHAGHLRALLLARGLEPHDGRVNTICTMFSLIGHAPKADGRKGWPKFAEACAWAGVERAATESAEDNARCLRQVFGHMILHGIVPEAKVWKERHIDKIA
jgi:hypothetical protein